MDNISRLIEQLHSPRQSQRYEACEWLRVAPSLPQEAIDALEQATHDPDPEVAEDARRAIAIHAEPDTQILPTAPLSWRDVLTGVLWIAAYGLVPWGLSTDRVIFGLMGPFLHRALGTNGQLIVMITVGVGIPVFGIAHAIARRRHVVACVLACIVLVNGFWAFISLALRGGFR